MATLADSFLDDLDDLGNDSDEDDGNDNDNIVSNESKVENHQTKANKNGEDSDSDSDDDDNNAMDIQENELIELVTAKTSNAIGSLRKSSQYSKNLSDIATAYEISSEDIKIDGLQDDPEYKLILIANGMIQDIDEEIAATHRYVGDIYSKKFPELEAQVLNKIDYIKTVQRIGNEMDMTLIELDDLLSSSTVMVVSVTGSTTSGKPLSEEDLNQCLKGCDEVLALDMDKGFVLRYVESRMSLITPNLCNVVGSKVAAQLIGLTGGLSNLTKIPSCNVQVLGQEKRTLSGFSNLAAMKNTGILYHTELVQSCPPFLRKKALKVVAAKAVLAARSDSYKNHADGSEGLKLKKIIIDKIQKWQEPPKARTKKALPAPLEKKRSKRGGKRARRLKERFAMTGLRQEQNKMSFSTSGGEYSDSAMGWDLGMVGSKDTGKVRATQRKDNKIQLSKKQKKMLSAHSNHTTNGLQSTVFTPIAGVGEGLELRRIEHAKKVEEANAKWFNNNSGFLSALPPK